MELVEGESLLTRLKRDGCLSASEAVSVTIRVAEALNCAWKKAKLIHRDIKPANIFLSKDGEVKVGDLGLAKSVAEGAPQTTMTGAMVGTPHYISPEQAQADKNVDFRTDIYSLGCTLFRMLAGQVPYTGDSTLAVVMQHVSEPPPSVRKFCANCHPKLAKIVSRMLAKKPEDRFQSYEELLGELKAVLKELPPDVARKDGDTVSGAPSKSNVAVITAGAVAVMLAAGGIFAWSPWKSMSPPDAHPSPAVASNHAINEPRATPSGEWMNLIAGIDPRRDAIAGDWIITGGQLRCNSDTNWSLCEIPLDYQDGDYDLRFRVTRVTIDGRAAGIFFMFRKASTGGVVDFDYVDPELTPEDIRFAGLSMVAGRHLMDNETRRERTIWFPIGQERQVLIQVRETGIFVSLDGEEAFRWLGDWKVVRQYEGVLRENHIDRPIFGVSTFHSRFAFHAVEFREVTSDDKSTSGNPPASK
jgi:hypothetical protein